MNWSDTIKRKQASKLGARLQEAVEVALKPPTKLTVSQWADRYRQLSSESSAEAGKWSTSRAE